MDASSGPKTSGDALYNSLYVRKLKGVDGPDYWLGEAAERKNFLSSRVMEYRPCFRMEEISHIFENLKWIF